MYSNLIEFTIYTLSINGNVFYVGRTTNPKVRLKNHMVKYGTDVQLVELHRYLDSPLPMLHKIDYESLYITKMISEGHKLINKLKIKQKQSLLSDYLN